MINSNKLEIILLEYIKDFPGQWWENEKFKWEGVKRFQDNWNISAQDFAEMFMQSTKGLHGILASRNSFPREMIKNFASKDVEAVRSMFINLYDETKNFVKRVEKFQSDAETLRLKYGKDIWKSHYQDANSATIYLWLRYPDKYYIYKYTECLAVSNQLESDFVPKRGASSTNLLGSFNMYNEICDQLAQKKEIVQLLKSKIDDNCFPDESLKILTTDFVFYIQKRYIHKPTFETPKTSSISGTTDKGNHNYWWLNANPKIWSFSDIGVGEIQSYTLYNEERHKRRVFQNFLDAKAGDLVIGYESNPVKQVVALAKISRKNDGEKLYFEKIEGLAAPIDYETLKSCSELKKMDYFISPQGSLFKLTEEEYNFIMDLIREENPNLPTTPVKLYSKDKFLEEVYLTEERLGILISLLKHKQNLILQGAPGVGKTFTAKRLAYVMMGKKDESCIELIQFHQNYAYQINGEWLFSEPYTSNETNFVSSFPDIKKTIGSQLKAGLVTKIISVHSHPAYIDDKGRWYGQQYFSRRDPGETKIYDIEDNLKNYEMFKYFGTEFYAGLVVSNGSVWLHEPGTGAENLIGRVAEDPAITYLRLHKNDAKNAQTSCIIA